MRRHAGRHVARLRQAGLAGIRRRGLAAGRQRVRHEPRHEGRARGERDGREGQGQKRVGFGKIKIEIAFSYTSAISIGQITIYNSMILIID